MKVRRQLLREYHEQAFAGPLRAYRAGRRVGKRAKRGAYRFAAAGLVAYSNSLKGREKPSGTPPLAVYNVIPEGRGNERVIFVSDEWNKEEEGRPRTRYAGHGRATPKGLPT